MLGKAIAAVVALFALLLGKREGATTQKQADQAATAAQQGRVEDAVNKAEASAPVDRAGTVSNLNRGVF